MSVSEKKILEKKELIDKLILEVHKKIV